MLTDNKIFDLSYYPEHTEEMNTNSGNVSVKLYSDISEYDRMAMLSHYIHNAKLMDENDRSLALEYVRDYIHSKDPNNDNSSFHFASEPSMQMDLFKDFFDVPFPAPKKPSFTYIDLFAGIGGIRIPFDEHNGKCVFSSEWDKAAQTTYAKNFGEIPFGDITKIKEDFIPNHDILLAGFPCQAFSIMGKMKGFEDTRGTMFFEVARILNYHHPKAILLENVKQLVSHDGGKTFKVILETLNSIGYHVKWKILNALDFGVPQKRESNNRGILK